MVSIRKNEAISRYRNERGGVTHISDNGTIFSSSFTDSFHFHSRDDQSEGANDKNQMFMSDNGTIFSSSFSAGLSPTAHPVLKHDTPKRYDNSHFDSSNIPHFRVDDDFSTEDVDFFPSPAYTPRLIDDGESHYSLSTWNPDFSSVKDYEENMHINPTGKTRGLICKFLRRNERLMKITLTEERALLSNKNLLDSREDISSAEKDDDQTKKPQRCLASLSRPVCRSNKLRTESNSISSSVPREIKLDNPELLREFNDDHSAMSSGSILPHYWKAQDLWKENNIDNEVTTQNQNNQSTWSCKLWRENSSENADERKCHLRFLKPIKKDDDTMFYQVWSPDNASNSLLVSTEEYDKEYGNNSHMIKGGEENQIGTIRKKSRGRVKWKGLLAKHQNEEECEDSQEDSDEEILKKIDGNEDILAALFSPKKFDANYEDFFSSFFWPPKKAIQETHDTPSPKTKMRQGLRRNNDIGGKKNVESKSVHGILRSSSHKANIYQNKKSKDKNCVFCIMPIGNKSDNQEVSDAKKKNKKDEPEEVENKQGDLNCVKNLLSNRDTHKANDVDSDKKKHSRGNTISRTSGLLEPSEKNSNTTLSLPLRKSNNPDTSEDKELFEQDDVERDCTSVLKTKFYDEENYFLDVLERLFLGPDENDLRPAIRS